MPHACAVLSSPARWRRVPTVPGDLWSRSRRPGRSAARHVRPGPPRHHREQVPGRTAPRLPNNGSRPARNPRRQPIGHLRHQLMAPSPTPGRGGPRRSGWPPARHRSLRITGPRPRRGRMLGGGRTPECRHRWRRRGRMTASDRVLRRSGRHRPSPTRRRPSHTRHPGRRRGWSGRIPVQRRSGRIPVQRRSGRIPVQPSPIRAFPGLIMDPVPGRALRCVRAAGKRPRRRTGPRARWPARSPTA
jgi:hypothetical protein